MAKNVAKFEKVTFAQFAKTLRELYPYREFEDIEIQMMYDTIEIPTRATKGSLGYDFVTPFDFTLTNGSKIAIPTGIRVVFQKDEWGLFMMPKSRNVKNSIRLSNTIGAIDTDYYQSDNEGHIIIFLEMPATQENVTHTSKFGTALDKTNIQFHYNAGDGFVQGMFVEIGLVSDDAEVDKDDRNGGFGSTDNPSTGDTDPETSGNETENPSESNGTDSSENTETPDSNESKDEENTGEATDKDIEEMLGD
jgi:dUTP pyrophosphatase